MIKKINFVLIWLGLLGLGTVMIMDKMNHTKSAFVTVGVLYNDFKMKKELENKLAAVQSSRKNIMDSLELQLKVLSNTLNSKTSLSKEEEFGFEKMKEEYLRKKKQFEEDNQAMTNQYTQEIMKQMNEYVQEYGKEKGFQYIYGAEGSGALMYANDREDITKEVLVFINDRYQGHK